MALNAADFSSTNHNFTYFAEVVHSVSVGGAAAGGPFSGGTRVEVFGEALQAISHCKLGNASGTEVAVPSTPTAVVCTSEPGSRAGLTNDDYGQGTGLRRRL